MWITGDTRDGLVLCIRVCEQGVNLPFPSLWHEARLCRCVWFVFLSSVGLSGSVAIKHTVSIPRNLYEQIRALWGLFQPWFSSYITEKMKIKSLWLWYLSGEKLYRSTSAEERTKPICWHHCSHFSPLSPSELKPVEMNNIKNLMMDLTAAESYAVTPSASTETITNTYTHTHLSHLLLLCVHRQNLLLTTSSLVLWTFLISVWATVCSNG